MKPILSLILLFISCQYIMSQDWLAIDSTSIVTTDEELARYNDVQHSRRLKLQQKLFPQEKIHLMTDAELYTTGDTIWFRGWIQDGNNFGPCRTQSNYLYVDLINNANQIKKIVKIAKRDNMYCGYMKIPPYIISGDYTLRAYTHYLIKAPVIYHFRKVIHLLSMNDRKRGYTVRPLLEKTLPAAQPLPIEGTQVYRSHNTDTLSLVSFDAPINTWLAVSVTDDAFSPIDTTYSINSLMPKIPDFFNTLSVSKSNYIYRPTTFAENTTVIIGSLKSSSKKTCEIFMFNTKTKKLYRTLDFKENHTFSFSNVDMPEGSSYLFATFINGKLQDVPMKFYLLALPDTTKHLKSDPRQYYVKDQRQNTSDAPIVIDDEGDELLTAIRLKSQINNKDSLQVLRDILHNTSTNNKRTNDVQKIIKTKHYVDDRYTINASKSILSEKFPTNLNSQQAISLMEKIADIQMIDSIPMYKCKDGSLIPVRLVLGEKELEWKRDSSGKLIPLLETFMPIPFLYAIDYISPEVAKVKFANRNFGDSPIIRLDPYKETDAVNNYYKAPKIMSNEALGYQEPLHHRNFNIRQDLVGTRFWNPAINSGKEGKIHLELPLPSNRHTTYTLRAEGITPEGELISIMRRIEM